MEMVIDFPGGARVDAHFGPYTVSTDQPPSGGGDGAAIDRQRNLGHAALLVKGLEGQAVKVQVPIRGTFTFIL